METSILRSTKQILGITPDDPSFDTDIITHINSTFSILRQIGIGPANGFFITDDTAQWSDFVSDEEQTNLIKTYVYLQIRVWFDPPTMHYLITSMKDQIDQYLWRLNVMREETAWVDPNPPALEGV